MMYDGYYSKHIGVASRENCGCVLRLDSLGIRNTRNEFNLILLFSSLTNETNFSIKLRKFFYLPVVRSVSDWKWWKRKFLFLLKLFVCAVLKLTWRRRFRRRRRKLSLFGFCIFRIKFFSFRSCNDSNGWTLATLIIIIKVEEFVKRADTVSCGSGGGCSSECLKQKNFSISTFDITRTRFLHFLSLAPSFSAPNAFIDRMSPHWKWWLVHTSATLRLGTDYFHYYYCELMAALRVPETNTYFFIAEKTKTIRDIYVEESTKERKKIRRSHRIVSHASVWFYGLFGI